MIFTVYYLAALVLVGAEALGRLRKARIPVERRPASLWVYLLVASYAMQIALTLLLARPGPWPFALVIWQPGKTLIIVSLLLLGLAQCYALLALLRTGISATLVYAGCAVMLLLSFVAPVLSNADLYAYVGNALLGLGAYAPPHARFAGEFGAINAFWGAPMVPTTYGPLWIAVVRLITSAVPTLVLKLFALRAFAVALFVALLLLLRAYGLSTRMLALVALNPALHFEFVLNAHNDLLPVTIVVGAAIVATAAPMIAAALVTMAALIKVPYILISLPVLARIRSMPARVAAAAAAIVAALAFSWLGGGAPYVRSLSQHVYGSHLETFVHAIAILVAAAMMVSAFAGLRRLRTAVWLAPMIGAYTASWYAIWGFPYALGARRVLAYFLLWLPFVALVSEPSFTRPWSLEVVLPAVVILSLAIPPRKRNL